MQILNRRKWLVGVSMVVCSGHVFSPASAATYAGMIGKYDEKPCFTLIQDGQEKTPLVITGKYLYVGDELKLDPAKKTCSVPVQLGQAKTITLTSEVPSHLIKVDDKVLSPPPSVQAGMGNFITGWWKEIWAGEERDAQNLQQQSPDQTPRLQELKMPLLKDDTALVVEGTNPLYLGWKGGNGTSVGVKVSCGGTVNIQQKEREATLEFKDVKAGSTCEVTVSELKPVKFKVVSEEEWQKALEEKLDKKTLEAIGKLDLNNSEGATWYASLLARHQDLRLQAYQKVAGTTDYYPANLVKIGLKRGVAFSNGN
ncbi:MAG: hypothetical protein BWK78_02800 [Thiotrichaceae bacterium IS1]|nr:MAG: hypothetical protein BWK78_02800 [Thiotrichaceae bacterium IS1]